MIDRPDVNGSTELSRAQAVAEILPLVYEELRRLASQKMAGQPAGHTLQATALVHEAWLRLASSPSNRFASRSHFLSAAAEAMRHILVDAARRKSALRHGGDRKRVDVEVAEIAEAASDDELMAVHEALDKLAAQEPQRGELVKLRYFAGMTFEEASEALGISVATAKRHWAYARAWLFTEIQATRSQ